MPPKKSAKAAAKGGKGKGKKDPASSKESLRLAQSEIAHLQQHIEFQKVDTAEARRLERLWRQRCEQKEFDFAQDKLNLQDIMKDTARKSTVQNDLKQNIIQDLEAKIEELERQNRQLQSQLCTMEHSAAEAANASTKEVKELRQRIQCMHGEFSVMMKQTLEGFNRQLLLPYIGNVGVDEAVAAQEQSDQDLEHSQQ